VLVARLGIVRRAARFAFRHQAAHPRKSNELTVIEAASYMV
jgi:hypothetical protein